MNDRVNGQTIDATFFNDLHGALEGDLVGRDTSGVATGGKNLGSVALPWGTVRATSMILNGSTLDPSQVTAPQNRVVSGKKRSTSNQPGYIKPNGAAASLLIEGASTNLVLDINGSSVAVSTDITKSGLTVAPSSGNTATLNDATATGQAATRTWGEGFNRVLTIASAGAEITGRVGKYAAFKTGTEYFLAFIKSATELSRAYRGFFYNPSYSPLNRVVLNNSDTITIMSLGWIFVENNGTTVDVTYNNPTWSFTSPAGPVTGDYWYDLANNTWKRYDGAAFQIINRTFVGLVVIDTSNAVAARSLDFFAAYSDLDTMDIELKSVTQARSYFPDQKVSIAGHTMEFVKSLPQWDITTDIVATPDSYNGSEQASTYYYLYLRDDGKTVMSDIEPYLRKDLLGYYHPHNPWRAVGKVFNSSGSDLTQAQKWDKIPTQHELLISGGNSTGSTSTIRRFSTIRTQTGKAISYTDSSTVGAIITINEDGLYGMTYTDGLGGSAGAWGIVRNGTGIASGINSLSAPILIGIANAQAAEAGTVKSTVSTTAYLNAGDVIWPQTSGDQTADGLTSDAVFFRIVKLQ